MAGTSPRRSSRARTTQPASQQSSTPSSTSGRPERNTRSFTKTGSPQKSSGSGSLSSEPPDDTIVPVDDTITTRRRTRGQDDERDKSVAKSDNIEMSAGGDELQEDDEAVRCICGFDEYPGPPPLDDDLKQDAKDAIEIDPVLPGEVTDDLAGFFVQCDICKVWQHGACVGIMTEESSPDEYFCEECRKDLHKIYTASNGQRYSHYLPLTRQSRATSQAESLIKDGTRSPRGRDGKNGRPSSATQTSKRRSTMNSRDAAYDEEEQLRRAIEESKHDLVPELEGTRRAKRGRSDSEEKPENAKRQRTSSRSISPLPDRNQSAVQDDSDDGTTTRNGAKKSRSAATRSQREKTEREEKERARTEAANKRKGRAERRRADGMEATILVKASEAHGETDSDPSEELPLAARTGANRTTASEAPEPAPDPPVSTQPTPDTPPITQALPTNSSKKSGRPTQKKKGRNQYTKDKEGQSGGSPARSQSRDVQQEENAASVNSGKPTADTNKSGSKAKGGMSSKVTMSDMKRRVTAMFEFISRTQVEMAGESPPETNHESRGSREDGIPSTVPLIKVNGNESPNKKPPPNAGPADGGSGSDGQQDFKELTCVEMMDSLTRDLVKWQNQYTS